MTLEGRLLLLLSVSMGCGTVTQREHFEITDVQREREQLPVEKSFQVDSVRQKEREFVITVASLATCRTAVVSVMQRELVTTRRVEKSWYYPAPLTSNSSVAAAIWVAIYAATVGLIDKLRESETREPAEPVRQTEATEELNCGKIPAAGASVPLLIGYYEGGLGPEFTWSPLGPALVAISRIVQTGADGRVRVELPESVETLPAAFALVDQTPQ